MSFQVGRTKSVVHKVKDGNGVIAEVGSFIEVGTIKMIPDGLYIATHQIRLEDGLWAKLKFVRVGWPGLAPRDKTGLHPYRMAPDGKIFSDSFSHTINGGGPLTCEIKVYGPPPGTQVLIETSIFKVKRFV